MTASNYNKVFKQLKNKAVKLVKYKKHNTPKKRSCSVFSKRCRRCGCLRAHIRKYGLHLCRRCFRDTALSLGFKKYR